MGVDTVANLFAYGDNMGRKFRQKLSTIPSKKRVPFLCYHRCKFIYLRRQYGTEISTEIEYQSFKKASTFPYVNVLRVPILMLTF